jgi:hypothetical protein
MVVSSLMTKLRKDEDEKNKKVLVEEWYSKIVQLKTKLDVNKRNQFWQGKDWLSSGIQKHFTALQDNELSLLKNKIEGTRS